MNEAKEREKTLTKVVGEMLQRIKKGNSGEMRKKIVGLQKSHADDDFDSKKDIWKRGPFHVDLFDSSMKIPLLIEWF